MNFSGKLKSSEFLVHTATLIGGSGIAQVLPLVFAPLIARLFTSDDFGVYGVFMSIYAILGTIITLRYEPAIMLPDEDNKSVNVVYLSFIASLILSILVFCIILIFQHQIALLFQIPTNQSSWLLLTPLAALFLAFNNILITWFNRKKKYKTIAANRITRNGLLTGANIGFGFSRSGYIGLILSQIISDFIAAIYYMFRFFKTSNITTLHFDKKALKSTAKEYIDFPKFVLPSTFIDTFSAQLPVLLIAALFSKELSGSYFFAYRILAIPIAFVGAAFAQTFYQKFVSSVQQKDFKGALRFLGRSWILLASVIVIPSMIVLFAGQPVFVFVFGNEWSESGKIATFLIIYIMFAFVSSPTSTTYIALGMQKYNLVFSIVVLAYRFLTLYIGYLLGDFYLGIIMLICCEVIEIIIFNLFVYKKLKLRIVKL